jgi:hypothetical protein
MPFEIYVAHGFWPSHCRYFGVLYRPLSFRDIQRYSLAKFDPRWSADRQTGSQRLEHSATVQYMGLTKYSALWARRVPYPRRWRQDRWMVRGCLTDWKSTITYQTSDMPWKRDIDEVFGVPSMTDMVQPWLDDQKLDWHLETGTSADPRRVYRQRCLPQGSIIFFSLRWR